MYCLTRTTFLRRSLETGGTPRRYSERCRRLTAFVLFLTVAPHPVIMEYCGPGGYDGFCGIHYAWCIADGSMCVIPSTQQPS